MPSLKRHLETDTGKRCRICFRNTLFASWSNRGQFAPTPHASASAQLRSRRPHFLPSLPARSRYLPSFAVASFERHHPRGLITFPHGVLATPATSYEALDCESHF